MDKRLTGGYKSNMPHRNSRFAFHVPRTASQRYAPISLLIVAALYLAALFSLPPQALTQHDTGAKYLQTRNLRITSAGLDWSINYPARSLDPELRFVPFRARQYYIDGERIYLQWPIFLAILTRIPWKVLGFWGLYVVPLLAGLGTLWAAYRLAIKVGVPIRYAWAAIPLLGLATPIAIYSLLFFEHTLAALLVTLSLLAGVTALSGPTPARRAIRLNAALLAVAIYFRSELYVLALVTGLVYLYMAWRDPAWRRPLLEWLGAFVAALAPLWLFYAINEGTILPLHAVWYFTGSDISPTSGASLELPAVRYIGSVGWRVVPDFLFGPQTFPSSPRFPFWAEALGMLGIVLCALPGLARLLRVMPTGARWQPFALAGGLGLVALPSLFALLSSERYFNLHGFLLASPFIALALWPMRNNAAQAQAAAAPPRSISPQVWLQVVTLLYVGLHALVISILSGLGPISRHEWGQRYLLPAYPALVVLSMLALLRLWTSYRARSLKSRLTTIAAPAAISLALVLVGVSLSLRGYGAMSEERAQVVAWQGLARTLPGREPLVTDVWWLPLNLAPDFYTRPIMLAEGDARLTAWARQMQARGVTRFGLMSDNPGVFSGGWQSSIQGIRKDGPASQAQGMWLQGYVIVGAVK